MEVSQKEVYAFDILNQLIDEFGLNDRDQVILTTKIQEAKTHEEMDKVLGSLKRLLLHCMWASIL